LDNTDKRVLQKGGINSLYDLSNLMDLPLQGSGDNRLTPNPDHVGKYNQLSNQWPVGPKLPLIVQRAKRALKVFETSTISPSFIYGAGFGSLPDDSEHPNLIKVFFDAQHDYLQDRIYMINSYIVGPDGEIELCEVTNDIPDAKSEREILISWIKKIFIAFRKVTSTEKAKVHLYSYNRYDQKMLLEALKRHLDALSLVPAFYDLITQSPALSQPMISFLYEEIQERDNSGRVCLPLHDSARARGFNWEDENRKYWQIFYAKMFDNRRTVIRNEADIVQKAPAGTQLYKDGSFSIESNSRFTSQIPLEYAYSAWGRLPETTEDSLLLDPYKGISLEDVSSFGIMRTKALHYLESQYRYKRRGLEKQEIYLPAPAEALEQTSLARSLREFVYVEHHTSVQEKMLNFSLPIERRVQTGVSLLLRFQQRNFLADTYEFAIAYEEAGLDPEISINGIRVKEQ
jgi:hypothetical protein